MGALTCVSQLPENWIPDHDLHNIQRRARKLLTTADVESSTTHASASNLTTMNTIQPEVNLANPPPPANQKSPDSNSSATKRRHEDDSTDSGVRLGGYERQLAKRGRFTAGHEVPS